MAVTLQSNEWAGESSSFTIDQQGKVIRKYTQKRIVKFYPQGYNWEVAKALNYEPGQQHPSDEKALLVSMDLDRRMTRATTDTSKGVFNICDLTLTYSTDAFAPAENSDDPTLARVKMSWQTQSQTLYIVKDRNGDAILNGARQPFEGGVPVTVELPTLTYERNEASFDGSLASAYSNAINSGVYAGCDPETLRLKISATKEWQGIYQFWNVKYEMAHFPLGWQPQPLNAGVMQIVSSKLVDCTDGQGTKVTYPVPLTTAGVQIALAGLPDAANYIKVDYFQTLNFGSLGLPTG